MSKGLHWVGFFFVWGAGMKGCACSTFYFKNIVPLKEYFSHLRASFQSPAFEIGRVSGEQPNLKKNCPNSVETTVFSVFWCNSLKMSKYCKMSRIAKKKKPNLICLKDKFSGGGGLVKMAYL